MQLKNITIKKSDVLYVLLGIILSAVEAVALAYPDKKVGLLGILALIGIVIVMLIIIKPSIGAYTLVTAIFSNISDNLTDQGYPGIIKLLVVIVFAAIMVRNYYAGEARLESSGTSRIEILLFFFLVAVIASYLKAADKDRAATAIIDLVKNYIIIYCILFALREPQTWKNTVWIIIGATAALSLLGIYQFITNDYTQTFMGLAVAKIDQVFSSSTTPRLAGPIHDPNMWGQVVAAVIPLVIFRMIHERRLLVKVVSTVILGILLFELLETYSRGAYLALAVAVLLIMFVFEKNINKTVSFAILGLIVLSLPFLPPAYTARFESLTSLSANNGIYQDVSFRGRASEVLTGLSMFVSNPFLGVGAGNFPNNYQHYAQAIGIELRSEQRDAHSLYVQVMAEEGVIGALPFFGILILLLDRLSKARRMIEDSHLQHDWLPWVSSIQVSIIAYLTAAFFLHGAYIRYFWILAALALVAVQLTDAMLKERDHSFTVEASTE